MPIASYLQSFADLPDLQHPTPKENPIDNKNIGIIPKYTLSSINCIFLQVTI